MKTMLDRTMRLDHAQHGHSPVATWRPAPSSATAWSHNGSPSAP